MAIRAAFKTKGGFLFGKLHRSEISALHCLDFNLQIQDKKFLACGWRNEVWALEVWVVYRGVYRKNVKNATDL